MNHYDGRRRRVATGIFLGFWSTPPVSPGGDGWIEMGSLDRESEWSGLLVAASGGERWKMPPLDQPIGERVSTVGLVRSKFVHS